MRTSIPSLDVTASFLHSSTMRISGLSDSGAYLIHKHTQGESPLPCNARNHKRVAPAAALCTHVLTAYSDHFEYSKPAHGPRVEDHPL